MESQGGEQHGFMVMFPFQIASPVEISQVQRMQEVFVDLMLVY